MLIETFIRKQLGLKAHTVTLVEESEEETNDQKERLSTLIRWNTPLIRAWYLKEAFQLFWGYRQPKRAGTT